MIVRGLMDKKCAVYTDGTVFVIFLWQMITCSFTGPSPLSIYGQLWKPERRNAERNTEWK